MTCPGGIGTVPHAVPQSQPEIRQGEKTRDRRRPGHGWPSTAKRPGWSARARRSAPATTWGETLVR